MPFSQQLKWGYGLHDVRDIRLSNIRPLFKGGATRKQAQRMPSELGARCPEPRHIGVRLAYGVFIRHARHIELSNAKVSFQRTDPRSAIVCQESVIENFCQDDRSIFIKFGQNTHKAWEFADGGRKISVMCSICDIKIMEPASTVPELVNRIIAKH